MSKSKKVCTRCKKQKMIANYYSNKTSKDGLSYWCKQCTSEKAKQYVEDNRQKVSESRRRYRQKNKIEIGKKGTEWRQENKEKVKKYSAKYNEKNREKVAEIRKIWREKNEVKIKAQYKVNYALKTQRLQREPCEICGDSKVDAHHTDYSKPLDVMWLCRSHHNAWHRVFIVEG